jgi:hypothetical protein
MNFPFWRPARVLPPASDTEADAEVGRQIRSVPDLCRFALDLGFDVDLEQRAHALLLALKSTVRAEVGDVAALQAAVTVARSKALGDGAAFEAADGDLLDQIAAAGTDRAAIVELLNRDPLNAPLPFVERIPVVRNGVTSWRTPIEHAIIRRRPADLAAFERLVGELDALFEPPQRGPRELVRKQVREALDRVRRDGQRDKAYVPTALHLLDRKIEEFVTCGSGQSAGARFEQLRLLIRQLTGMEQAIDTASAADVRSVTELASRYVATQGLHLPSLTDRVVALLLAPRYISVSTWYRRRRFYSVLRLVRQEVMQGHYDSGEIVRRLQRLETQGAFFSSLVYPLLRLAAAAAGPAFLADRRSRSR